jgi:hypothetical protein
MKHKMTIITAKLTHWSKSRLYTLPPFFETSQFITKSEKTNIPYDLYQPPSMIPQPFMRYLEAYTTANTNLPTHNLADTNPRHLSSNLMSLPQLPTKPYFTPVSNPSPTIVFPTPTIPIPTHQHIFNNHLTLLTIPTILHHPRHRNRQPRNNYVSYDQYELANDGSDFDNYDDIWSQPALPCYH